MHVIEMESEMSYAYARQGLDQALAATIHSAEALNRATTALGGGPVPLADGEQWSIRCPFSKVHQVALSDDGRIAVIGEGGPAAYNNGGISLAVGNVFDPRQSAWSCRVEGATRVRFAQWVEGELSFTYSHKGGPDGSDEYHRMVWGDWGVTVPHVIRNEQGYSKTSGDLVRLGHDAMPWCWRHDEGRHMAIVVSDGSARIALMDRPCDSMKTFRLVGRFAGQHVYPKIVGVYGQHPVLFTHAERSWHVECGERIHTCKGDPLIGTLHQHEGQLCWIEQISTSGFLVNIQGESRKIADILLKGLLMHARYKDTVLAVEMETAEPNRVRVVAVDGSWQSSWIALSGNRKIAAIGVVDDQTLLLHVNEGLSNRLLFMDVPSGEILPSGLNADPMKASRVNSSGNHFRRIGDRLVMRWNSSETGPWYSVLRRPEPHEIIDDLLCAHGSRTGKKVDMFDLAAVDGSILSVRHVGGNTLSIRAYG